MSSVSILSLSKLSFLKLNIQTQNYEGRCDVVVALALALLKVDSGSIFTVSSWKVLTLEQGS